MGLLPSQRRGRQWPTCLIYITAFISCAVAGPLSPLEFSGAVDFSVLDQRQANCPVGFFSCADQGSAFANTCCQSGQQCGLDDSNQAACCPSGATCTGRAPTGPVPTASFVENTYFPFPYVATAFTDSAACTSAVSQCSNNYQACTSDLTGGGWGVTVVVPGGGGTTVAPTNAQVPLATATSVCSSLSSKACHGLQNSQCTGDVIHSGAALPRITGAPCMAGLVVGVGIGIVGGQI